MSSVVVDDVDAELYPTMPAGVVPDEWITARMLGTANLGGEFWDITHSETLATLWAAFASVAVRQYRLADFDGAALQNAGVRPLTQAISARLYAITLDDEAPAIDGIQCLSRFGADQELWTVFEQPVDSAHSRLLTGLAARTLSPFDAHVRVAFRTLGLTSHPV